MFGAFDRTRRVLVIDDNSAIHEDFRKVLEGDRGSADLDDATAAFFGEQPAMVQRPRYDVTSALPGRKDSQFWRGRLKCRSHSMWHLLICECRPDGTALKR